MYPKYLRDTILQELNDSCEYLKKALDCIKRHPEWAKKLKLISDDRYKAAQSLYGIFLEVYKNSKESDTYMNSIRDGIIDNITIISQKIDSYKETYDFLIDSEGDDAP